VLDKVVIYVPEPFYGKADEDMRDVYNCFDVLISTTQGEGMGLTAMEAMACGVPCILPDWSALGEWARGAAMLIPCTSTAPQSFSPSVNVIGGVADEKMFIVALEKMYREKDHRKVVANYGLARMSEDRFRWSNIGDRWLETLDDLFAEKPETPTEIWQDLKAKEVPV
jgi:glycosyltransferase involved in cell wall biosynthesis